MRGMSLASAIASARSNAEQLKASGSGNEANTKALLIEPLLGALGWDLTDLQQVDREFRVYDGTALDYALKIAGKPRLFVEAKAVTKSLDDKQFIAQTVNYANNEGVVWCVLTNGLAFRVYKTNEPVGMAEKLLFEVNLGEPTNDTTGSVGEIDLISRAAVEEGRLDDWGERVFTDSRVRQALAELAVSPRGEILARINEILGKPEIAEERVRESLARILGGSSPPASPHSKGRIAVKPRGAKGKVQQEHALEHHTGGKPAAVVDLFEQLDAYGQSLGGDVTRRIRKFYIGYFAGSKERSFFTAELQRQKIWVYLGLDPTKTQPWNAGVMRDVREIGHYGMGDTEYVLLKPEQLEDVKVLIKQAYDRVH
jgi:predicted transport protein